MLLQKKDISKGYGIMKSINKKIIAIFAVLCVAMSSMASCGDKPNSSDGDGGNTSATTIDRDALMKYPLNIGSAGDGNAFAGEADLEGDDPVAGTTEATTAEESTKPVVHVTAVQEVTDANNQPVTKIVEVTEANGEKKTDANNQPVTEVVKVTEVVTVPAEETPADNPENPDTQNPEESTEAPTESDYKPKNDGRYAMWIDCSKNENFFFEGAMLKATFKVKEGIPDGDYKIRISPDLSTIEGKTVNPSKVMDGTIRVNNGEIEPVDVSNENGSLVFYGDNIACKQGDTIDFNINVKNNTGLAAFCIWFYFDGNALEFVDACATGEYEEIARQTDIGSGKKDN